ncbi:MAG: hypothetical protein MUF87_22310 [Anaerolineae bacterium]|nr:hypothetical protein [Anaerolineae bacterium]
MRTLPAILMTLLALWVTSLPTTAQIDFEWERWDVTITVQSETDLAITEIQEFALYNGTVERGTRTWTQPVQIDSVFYVGQGGRAEELRQSNGGETPGTYTVSERNETILTYYLPEASRSNFVVQINYYATSPVEGVLDWIAIPGRHGAPVNNSTVTINFENGDTPDPGLVRITAGSGDIQVNGDQVVITADRLGSDDMFAIQLPFGLTGGNTGGFNQAPDGRSVAPAPSNQGNDPLANFQMPGLGTICAIICIVGVLMLFGGGNLLRGLGGGLFGGGRGGGLFGGGGSIPTPRGRGNPFGGLFGGGNRRPGSFEPRDQPSERGFRRSSRQNRDVPSVRGKNDDGGSAGLG